MGRKVTEELGMSKNQPQYRHFLHPCTWRSLLAIGYRWLYLVCWRSVSYTRWRPPSDLWSVHDAPSLNVLVTTVACHRQVPWCIRLCKRICETKPPLQHQRFLDSCTSDYWTARRTVTIQDNGMVDRTLPKCGCSLTASCTRMGVTWSQSRKQVGKCMAAVSITRWAVGYPDHTVIYQTQRLAAPLGYNFCTCQWYETAQGGNACVDTPTCAYNWRVPRIPQLFGVFFLCCHVMLHHVRTTKIRRRWYKTATTARWTLCG